MIISILSLYMCLILSESVVYTGKVKQCRRKNRLITARKNDLYELVDAINSQEIMLQCHYCFEKDNNNPKFWYKQARPFKTEPGILKTGSSLEPNLERVMVNPEHTLIIKNYSSVVDEGIYYCHGKNGEEAEYKFNYLVDTVVNMSDIEAEVGDALGWRKYQEKYLEPINKIIEERLEEHKNLTPNKERFQLEAMTEWEPWGRCIVCGLQEGQRRRRGICRFHATKLNPPFSKARHVRDPLPGRLEDATPVGLMTKTTEDDVSDAPTPRVSTEKLLPIDEIFRSTPTLSCRSLQLVRSEGIPNDVTEKLAKIPDYIQIERCNDLCRKEGATSKLQLSGKGTHGKENTLEEDIAEGVTNEENEEPKKERPRAVQLKHGDRLTLVCPGASASSVVTWKKNGRAIEAGGGRDTVNVDAFGTLHKEEVGAKDTGSYACAVDGIDTSVITVEVEGPQFVDVAEYLRHSTYVLVVVALISVVYCSRLVVEYYTRYRFRAFGYSKVDTVEDGTMETGL